MKNFKKGKKPMKVLLNTGAVFLSLSLVACGGIDMYQEGTLNDKRVQVVSENFKDSVPIEDVNEVYLGGLAKHYSKYGDGLMDVVVTYDARSTSNTAMKAGDKAAQISKILRRNGVRDLDVGVLPVKNQGDYSRMIVSYEGYSASAPKGCENLLPGLNGDALEHDEDYRLGCSVESIIARQVSRPADLMGNGVIDATSEGRAATNIVDVYRSGAPNEPLDGEKATSE
ncbi:MAG: CpaD family pilus assembly lipoprotein [Alphaproteobacteria bacterium]